MAVLSYRREYTPAPPPIYVGPPLKEQTTREIGPGAQVPAKQHPKSKAQRVYKLTRVDQRNRPPEKERAPRPGTDRAKVLDLLATEARPFSSTEITKECKLRTAGYASNVARDYPHLIGVHRTSGGRQGALNYFWHRKHDDAVLPKLEGLSGTP